LILYREVSYYIGVLIKFYKDKGGVLMKEKFADANKLMIPTGVEGASSIEDTIKTRQYPI